MQEGERLSIGEITDQFVELNREETAEPDGKAAEVYRELQGLQNEMSTALRGAFKRHREFVLRRR